MTTRCEEVCKFNKTHPNGTPPLREDSRCASRQHHTTGNVCCFSSPECVFFQCSHKAHTHRWRSTCTRSKHTSNKQSELESEYDGTVDIRVLSSKSKRTLLLLEPSKQNQTSVTSPFLLSYPGTDNKLAKNLMSRRRRDWWP